ncbi:hypothetical protein T01_7268, partial [Trichinella spiralis]
MVNTCALTLANTWTRASTKSNLSWTESYLLRI